ncbi:hypothetical protein FDZ71_08640 [bacterium]|nr:MAG: hypothetical protein FDZ71_08640 [bacterium]
MEGPFNPVGAVDSALLVASMVTGATALIRYRGSSWLVWLSTALPAIAIAFRDSRRDHPR